MTLYGYARVSTNGQTLASQDAQLHAAGAAKAVRSRSVMESAMLILHSGRPYGTDPSRQRQDRARRLSLQPSRASI